MIPRIRAFRVKSRCSHFAHLVRHRSGGRLIAYSLNVRQSVVSVQWRQP